ncbi:MAG: hypothetical protein R2762_06660 [Bryobacteraceae bacterium]
MSTEDRFLILTPAVLLASGAAWLVTPILKTRFLPDSSLALAALAAAALHTAWLGSVVRRRAWLGGVVCWFVCLHLAFGAGGHAAAAEIIALSLALGLHREPLDERLARWRRTRALIRAELENATGIWHWLAACQHAFFHNDHRRDTALERARFLVEMRDAERVAACLPPAHGTEWEARQRGAR